MHWTASANEPWITIVSGTQGRGDGEVSFSIAPGNGPPRIGTFTIAGQSVQVEQGTGCTYAIPNETVMVAPSAAIASRGDRWSGLRVERGERRDLDHDGDDVGDGPGSATFTVAPNLSPARSATLVIAGQNHIVNQASQCRWSFGPTSHDMPAAGGFGIVLVFLSGGECSWTATSTVDWIRLTSIASGSGGGNVQFLVSPNTGSARTGVILIAGEQYPITQQAR